MARNQRERLISGLTDVLHDVGYQKTTVSLIGKRASVSKSDFYKHFETKDDCFVAAYDKAVERIRERVDESCAKHADEEWPPRVREAITALVDFFCAEPAVAALALVEGLRAGRGVYDRYQVAVESFVPYLRDGAPDAPGGGEVPRATDEAVIGGIVSLLGKRLVAGEESRLEELKPAVLEFALTPYLGTVEARRVIAAGAG